MGCCKEKTNEIPNLSGELKIWNEDNSITTIPLNEREVWVIKASLKETLKRATNEPGFANGEAKKLIIDLVEKITPKEATKLDDGCKEGNCECMS